ncbi:MAG: GTP 3',8-cyclase MoaA [Nitriliruptorales bacterium]|nr:GTP 3',8-cyclase MoaA [Nitriliruptorales bacterium]
MPALLDRLKRPLRDLRVSVTDRCNLRCRYCMPREVYGPGFEFLDRDDLLTFEEIARITRAFARNGVTKVRLTGGEPLLRRDLPALVRMLADIDGIDELALTTNALLLPSVAGPLRDAGVDRLTVSLDALDDPTFRRMSDTRRAVGDVLEGIDAAMRAGFPPPKINAVVRRGVNEHAVVDLAAFGRQLGSTVRFIEFMDVGHTNGWSREEVVPAEEILDALASRWELDPVGERGTAPAERYRYRDGGGEIGVIASVTRPFCRTCVRARLSAVGELFTCLFATVGRDLRAVVRSGATAAELDEVIGTVWSERRDRYSEERRDEPAADPARVEMSYIGG